MVFHWSLSDSKSPGFFSVFWSFSIMLSFWMVSTCPPTSKYSSLFNNPLVTAPKAPITIGIIVTFMYHNFFQFPCKVEVLILLFTFFQFYSMVSQDSNSTILQILFFFFFCWLLLSLVFWPRLGDLSVCQSPKVVYVYHFVEQLLGCTYTICLYGPI